MQKLGLLTAAAALVAVFGFAGTAIADIEVEKEIVAIDVNDNDTDVITDPGEITTFLADVPVGTEISFTVEITVESPAGAPVQNLTDVVVTDRFGAELSVSCVDATTAGGCADVDLATQGGSNKVFLTWTVGTLGEGDSEVLTLEALTDEDPSENQEYTECGPHEFNSGPTAKGRVERINPGRGNVQTRQDSDVGAQILLTVTGCI